MTSSSGRFDRQISRNRGQGVRSVGGSAGRGADRVVDSARFTKTTRPL
ncbi:hypothetical protein BKA15_004599 [Microlunatus parietis]|uniref:Uncharacterized protein n=1 Tax=Microlunatus parietis TaxID=682979 RepID=A0A7Y9IAU2_9ACTN|nr:hypothetical protein [Microlunatus parietis]